MKLKELKKEYLRLEKKYKLPKFIELNRDFEIDKLDKDTDLLLRAVRKLMMEKIVNSMSFLEMLVNPVNAPRMYIPYVRTMSLEDRKIIDKIYVELAGLTLLSLELEIESNEKNEADVIKRAFSVWQGLKPVFRIILNNIKKPRNFEKRERSYFG